MATIVDLTLHGQLHIFRFRPVANLLALRAALMPLVRVPWCHNCSSKLCLQVGTCETRSPQLMQLCQNYKFGTASFQLPSSTTSTTATRYRVCAGKKSEAAKLYTEGLKDRRNYTNFSNRRCKFSISPTRCSDRRYSCCKSSVSRGFKRFLKTDLMTVFYSSPRKNCKKPREKSIFYSLSIRGVAEVALNQ